MAYSPERDQVPFFSFSGMCASRKSEAIFRERPRTSMFVPDPVITCYVECYMIAGTVGERHFNSADIGRLAGRGIVSMFHRGAR